MARNTTSEYDRADALAIVQNVDGQQIVVIIVTVNARPYAAGNMLRIAEHRQNQQGGDAQHGVDHRNVQLAAGTSRMAHLQVGHPVESRRRKPWCRPVINACEAITPAHTDKSSTAT